VKRTRRGAQNTDTVPVERCAKRLRFDRTVIDGFLPNTRPTTWASATVPGGFGLVLRGTMPATPDRARLLKTDMLDAAPNKRPVADVGEIFHGSVGHRGTRVQGDACRFYAVRRGQP